jgi:zinc protease
MKAKIFNSFLFFLPIFLLPFVISGNHTDSGYRYFRMDNGLQVFLRQKPGIPIVNMVMGINLGSKDETSQSLGRVHLLEHLLLSSPTLTFKKDKLIRELRKRGCYLNAHTDHDLMTFEMSAPKNETGDVVPIFKEKLFDLAPRDIDLAREKEIILEEINQIQDNPFLAGTNAALGLIFANHPYGNPIYGDSRIIQDTSLDQITELYHSRFVPSNCSLAVVGDFLMDDMENRLRDLFSNLSNFHIAGPPIPEAEPMKKEKEIRLLMDTEQAYLIMAYSAPEFGQKDQFAFDVFNHMLGKGIHPLLGMAVRSRKKMTSGFSTRYLALKYGGVFLIYLTVDPKKIFLLQREVQKFLDKTNTFRYAREDFLEKEQTFITDYLESSKNQIKFNAEEFKQQGLNSAISMARFLLLKTDSNPYNYREEINRVKSSDLRRVASEYICGQKPALVFILPGKK